MAEDVKCRLNYIEPSNIAVYSNGVRAIVPSNELVLRSPEDFCIAVDLEVIIPNRKSCALAKENNDYIRMNYSSTNGTLSFMHGTSGAFTTNFTDINVVNPEGNTAECLGIESIEVEHNEWQYPIVTIKFVDVRGGSVMLPEEKALQDGGLGSIYRALFSLPSPLFKLTVKGFYGKGVTYYLCEESVDIDMDSSSGDFNITAKFVGMMFRVYSDIPMTYLCAAPYMDGGNEYWKTMVENGTFVFNNRSGTKTEMCKFPELKKRIAQAAQSAEKVRAEALGEQSDASFKEKTLELTAIRDMYPLRNWFEAKDGFYLATSSDVTKEKIAEDINAFLERVKKYDEAYETNYFEYFENLEQFGEKKGKKIKEYFFTMTTTPNGKEHIINKEGLDKLEGKDDVIAYVKGKNIGAVKLYEIPLTSASLGGDAVTNKMNKQITELQKQADEQSRKYKEMVDAEVEKALGFTPSIKNLYDLAFAHMDTFMHVFYEHMDVIKKKLNDNDPERLMTTYNMTPDNSDIKEGEVQVPPYPAFYKDTITTVDGREERRRQLLWPEDVPDGYKLDEVNFVKNLLNASQQYFSAATQIIQDIENMKTNGDKEGDRKHGGSGDADNLKGAPSVGINQIVPVTISDFINKDKSPNPYAWVKKVDENNNLTDSQQFEDAVMGSFAIRALHYLSVNDDRKDPEMFGKLEALNFVNEFRDTYFSNNFYDFIEKYANGSHGEGSARDIVRRMTDNTSDVWGGILKGESLLKKSSKGLSFGLSRNDSFFPIDRTSALDIKNDMNVNYGGISSNRAYIPENRDNDGITSSNDTFFYLEDSRDYVNEVYKNIEEYIDNGDYGFKSGDIKKFKNNIDNIQDRKNDVKYVDNCIYDESGKGQKGNGIYDLLNTSRSNLDSYWIKYPSMVDESQKDSLFDEDFYKGQDNTYSKAYLFLLSIPMKSNRKSGVGNGCIPEECENGVQLKAQLLREGAIYWRAKKMGSGEDPIKTSFAGKRYKSASKFELYMVDSNNNKETVTMLSNKISLFGANKYLKWSAPDGCTVSRMKVLTDLFKNWADKEFEPVEKYLSSPDYYTDGKFSKGINHDLVKSGGNKQPNAIALDKFLKDTYFKVSTIFDYYAGRPVKHDKFYAKQSELRSAYGGFMEVLNKVYGEAVKKGREATSFDVATRISQDPFNNTDLRLSTYMTLKNLYDRWFVAPFKGRDTWSFTSEKSDFKSFAYIDSFYHDIGKTLNVNVTKVDSWISSCMPTQNIQSIEGIMKYTGRSLYQYLGDIAQSAGGTLMAFPQKIGGVSTNHMAEIFDVYSYNSNWATNETSYVFIYTYKNSEHQGNGQYADDGMDLETEQIKTLLSDEGYQIPAFGVTYAKQNQSLFKNITLNTNSPAVTEVSIQSTMNIAAKGGDGQRETSLFGQDIYRIKSSYAYQCEFDMMGCMQIVPLMYFQLNNVPFWRGGYVIFKVNHSIRAGDVTTHVMGQRLNKYAIPLTDGIMAGDKSTPTREGPEATGEGYTGNTVSYGEQTNVVGNPNVKIPHDDDFKEENIAEDKPLICLWPAHGPNTEKGSEWYWSTKLIDEYIIPKLRNYKFYDGTSYSDNIHRANRTTTKADGTIGAENTDSTGYSGKELRSIISKYGSNKVISIVPHWNGGYGNYFMACRGEELCQQQVDGQGKKSWSNCTDRKMRGDSYVLATIFEEEVQKTIERAKNHEFHLMPEGMMERTSQVLALLKTKTFGDGDRTDPAVRLDCACVLTENFFVDYNGKGQSFIAGPLSNVEANKSKYSEKTANGAYKYGEGWLFSDEGLNVISDYHVEAIRRYINNLHDKTNAMATVGNFSSDSVCTSVGDIYTQCAQLIGCEVAAFKAVKQVETGNVGGFFAPGKPAILFEGQVFWKQLEKAGKNPKDYVNGNNDILYPTWTKAHYKGGMAEYDRLEKAKKIDEVAALASASWGMFQVMGFNYAACGYSSVKEFVKALSESEDAQILAAARFISRNSNMKNALINKDWATFARYYNGPGYAKNKYDEKLQAAYDRIISSC